MRLAKPTLGPILGAREYGSTSAEQYVLVRGRHDWTKQSCFMHIYSDDGRYNKFFKISIGSKARDFTGSRVIKNLPYDTRFHYRVGIIEGQHTVAEAKASGVTGGFFGSFSTRNPDASTTSFVFGSCCHFSLAGVNNADDAAFKTMREQWNDQDVSRDDFIMMLGDQIYGDHRTGGSILGKLPVFRQIVLTFKIRNKSRLKFKHYLAHYKKAFGKLNKRKIMASIPTYMMFDDHEVHNDWGGDKFLTDEMDYRVLRDALKAYNLYQVSHPGIKLPEVARIRHGETLPEAKYYYEFKHGKCDFFVMDTRYEKIPDKVNPRMISDRQMSALEKFLQQPGGRVKFIATSVPMFPDAELSKINQIFDNSPDDRWEGHVTERKRLLDQIKANIQNSKSPNVIFLSGDVHCSYVCSLTSKLDNGFKVHQITSSAFNWGVGLNDRHFAKSAPLKGTAREYKPKNLSGEVIHQDNFCRVVVKTDKVDVRFYHAKTGTCLDTVTLDLL